MIEDERTDKKSIITSVFLRFRRSGYWHRLKKRSRDGDFRIRGWRSRVGVGKGKGVWPRLCNTSETIRRDCRCVYWAWGEELVPHVLPHRTHFSGRFGLEQNTPNNGLHLFP